MQTCQRILDIPDKALLADKTDIISFAQELRILAAVKRYELDRLSSRRAADLADMPQEEFLSTFSSNKVFPFHAELNDLEEHHA